MKGIWVAVLSAGLMVSGGAVAHAQMPTNTAQPMSRADRKAEQKTHKAEVKASKNNAKAAREQVKTEERKDRASSAGEKLPARMAAVQEPPM